MVRFSPSSWDHPDLEDWTEALSLAVKRAPKPPLLVVHSLACLLVAHWAASEHSLPIAGAFMVSVPDSSRETFPREASGFAQPPAVRFPFPTLVLASSDDPFGSVEHAKAQSREWGAGFVQLGRLGHVSADSEIGDWEEGRRLLDAFMAGLGLPANHSSSD